MSDTVQTAPEQPAPVEQKSSENKGAGNTSQADFARKLAANMAAQQAQQKQPVAEAPKTEAKAEVAQETGEANEAPAETEAKETETEEKSETPETEEKDEVLSPENHTLDPKLKAKIDRRIGKEVAKRKELERKIASLEAAVSAQAAPITEEKEVVVHAPANVPLAEITSLAQLEQLRHNARTELRWAEQWLDEDIPPEGIQTDRGLATKKQLKELRRNALAVQEDMIPQRETFLKSRQTASQQALEKFPFLKDPTHPGYQLAQQAKRENAHWLAGLPNADWIVGVQVMGHLAMQQAQAKPEAKAPVKPKQRPTSGQGEIASDASASRVPVEILGKTALGQESAKLAAKRGVSAKDFAAALSRKQQIRNSQ